MSFSLVQCKVSWTPPITTLLTELRVYVPLNTKNKSFWRHSSQPISWHSTEETKHSVAVNDG